MVKIDLNMEPEEVAEEGPKEGKSCKTLRKPKWANHETMAMLKGKYAVENSEPGAWRSRVQMVTEKAAKTRKKWPLVSAYCEEHGVRRTPRECKQRWQNLMVRFRQIHAWEEAVREGGEGGAAESYWKMSNLRRRDWKLPGVCNREIYEVLIKMEPAQGDINVDDRDRDEEEEEEEEEEDEIEEQGEREKEDVETGSGSGNNNAKGVEKRGLEDTNKSLSEGNSAGARLERKANDPSRASVEGADSDEDARSTAGGGEERRFSINHSGQQNKRRRLINVMENNSRMIKAHVEACQEDHEERNKQANSLIAVLSKISDAIMKIAEKL